MTLPTPAEWIAMMPAHQSWKAFYPRVQAEAKEMLDMFEPHTTFSTIALLKMLLPGQNDPDKRYLAAYEGEELPNHIPIAHCWGRMTRALQVEPKGIEQPMKGYCYRAAPELVRGVTIRRWIWHAFRPA